jgi:hypothetical protein
VLARSSKIKEVRLSKSAYDKCSKDILEWLTMKGINYKISDRNPGRPNIIENRFEQMILKANPLLNYSKSYMK